MAFEPPQDVESSGERFSKNRRTSAAVKKTLRRKQSDRPEGKASGSANP
jgi:hypothetical protein